MADWEWSSSLDAARRGDASALAAIYERYAASVTARIHGRLRGEMRRLYQTTDILQSVFTEVLNDLPRFEDRGEAAFRHWLFIKAESKIKKKLRKHLDAHGRQRISGFKEAARPVPAAGTGPGTAAERTETRKRIRACLDALAPNLREVIRLRVDENLSYADVALRLGLPSADAARMRFSRALVRLREQWKPSS